MQSFRPGEWRGGGGRRAVYSWRNWQSCGSTPGLTTSAASMPQPIMHTVEARSKSRTGGGRSAAAGRAAQERRRREHRPERHACGSASSCRSRRCTLQALVRCAEHDGPGCGRNLIGVGRPVGSRCNRNGKKSGRRDGQDRPESRDGLSGKTFQPCLPALPRLEPKAAPRLPKRC